MMMTGVGLPRLMPGLASRSPTPFFFFFKQ